ADLIITGEGRLDAQSLRGKVVAGVAGRAAKLGIPVLAVVGDVEGDMPAIYQLGVTAVFTTNRKALPFQEIKPLAKAYLRDTLEDLVRFAQAVCR
ncbi:MAG TPA: glycerate kinase, partial [Clostridiales bacterium]|nr:glycerate kinase [Clostridiales bacterium]